MSHFTKVETKIRDLVCLEQALDDLGFGHTRAEAGNLARVRGYQGQSTEAELVVHASRTYDVGVQVDAQGNVGFVADWWGVETTRGLTEKDFVSQVTARYSYHKVIKELRARGYAYTEEKQDDRVHIKVISWR